MSSLIKGITDILSSLNHPNPQQWLSDELILIATTDSNEQFERLYVNRYWRHYLGQLNIDTTIARFHLTDDNSINEYLSYFKIYVAPVIINNL